MPCTCLHTAWKLILLLAALSINLSSFAQLDSVKFNFDIIFGADRFFEPRGKDIYLPGSIREQRIRAPQSGLNLEEFTDIPQFHASVFTGLLINAEMPGGYNLHVELFAEDRGQSFGSLDLGKVVIFPRIYGIVKEGFELFNRNWTAEFKIGDLIQYQNNHGLTLHNIDAQGLDARLTTGPWWIGYTLLGDVSRHVGLNIGEFFSYKFGFHHEESAVRSTILGASLDLYNRVLGADREHLSLFLRHKRSTHSYYTEMSIGLPYDDLATGFNDRMAVLLGYEQLRKKEGTRKWLLAAKIRYYGRYFNNGFIDRSQRYRDFTDGELVGNYIGDFLYPLINSYRDFDQWSIYAEYSSKSLFSTILASEFEQKIIKKLYGKVNMESNLIYTRSSTDFYNFYTIGLKQKLPAGMSFEVYATNKIMNLDAHYQTFYQSEQPVFGFSIRRLKE